MFNNPYFGINYFDESYFPTALTVGTCFNQKAYLCGKYCSYKRVYNNGRMQTTYLPAANVCKLINLGQLKP